MPIDTNMLAYFMGAAGQGIASGNVAEGLAPAVMGVAGKNMAAKELEKRSKSYMNMIIGDALGGGGSITVNKDGFNLKGPATLLGNKTKEAKPGGLPDMTGVLTGLDYESDIELPDVANPTVPTTNGFSIKDLLNFSAGPQVEFLKNADLTGLSPEDINSALQMNMLLETRGLDVLAKALNIKSTQAQIQNYEDDNARAWYTTLNKDERTEQKKQFDDFNKNLIENGKAPVTMEEWVNITQNDSYRDYRLGKKDPDYLRHLISLKKAGATSINVGTGQKAFEGEVGKNIGEVMSPQYPSSIEKKVKDDFNDTMSKGTLSERKRILRLTKEQKDKEIRLKTRKTITQDLMAAGQVGDFSVIVGQNDDGTVSWYKKLPNGKAQEIYRY